MLSSKDRDSTKPQVSFEKLVWIPEQVFCPRWMKKFGTLSQVIHACGFDPWGLQSSNPGNTPSRQRAHIRQVIYAFAIWYADGCCPVDSVHHPIPQMLRFPHKLLDSNKSTYTVNMYVHMVPRTFSKLLEGACCLCSLERGASPSFAGLP